jgi:uncharacterized repeat protein (TIGR01451 family)
VNNPLPPAVIEITDPHQPGANDPTTVPIMTEARLYMAKKDALLTDADSNNEVSPGDTLVYLITVANVGNAAATGVVFTDTPDPETSLVNGSVQTTQGIVTGGNTGGDVGVEIQVGALAANTSVTIGFQVMITPAAGTQVANQALVRFNDAGGAGPFELSSDDPDTVEENDPTVTLIVGPGQSHYIFLPLVD